jgi:hypothetical protein
MIGLQPELSNEQIALYPLKVCDLGDLYAVASDPEICNVIKLRCKILYINYLACI